MQEMENEGISLLEICGILWKRKIWIAIATLVSMIIFILLIVFWYNPSKVVYRSTFELNFNGSSNMQYPNGETFNYYDIITKDKMIATKESDPKFKKLDVERLYDDGNFTISKINNSSNASMDKYEIVISKVNTTNQRLISDFVSKLIQDTINLVENKSNSDIHSFISQYDEFKTYSEIIQFFTSQEEYLLSKYEELSYANGDFYVVNNQTLKYYRNEVERKLNDINTNYYLSQIERYNYVKNSDDYLKYTQMTINDLIKRKEKNNQIILQLKAITEGIFNNTDYFASISAQMEQLALENADIMTELNTLAVDITVADTAKLAEVAKDDAGRNLQEFTLLERTESGEKAYTYALKKFKDENDPDTKVFDATIKEAYNTYMQLTETLENNLTAINMNSIILNFESNRVITSQGTMNGIIAAIAGIVVGFALSAVVVLIIDLPKLRKKEEKEETTN